MKFLFYSDLHFGQGLRGFNGDLNKTLYNNKVTCDFISEQIKSVSPDIVINAGDTFDTGNVGSIDLPSLNTGIECIHEISEACHEVESDHYIISGNHDGFIDSGYALLTSQLRKAVDSSGVIDWALGPKIIKKDNISIGLVPFGKNKQVKKWLSEIEADYIVTHNDVVGATNGRGYVFDKGLVQEDFKCKKVFCGHIHKPQTVGKVIFVGSSLYKDFKDVFEADNPRGVYVYDTDKEDGYIIKNKVTKIYITKSVESKEDSDSLYKYLNVSVDYSNDLINVSVVIDDKDLYQYLSDILFSLGLCTYRIRTIDNSLNVKRSDISITMSPNEVIDKWLDKKGVTDKTIKDIGVSIIKEAEDILKNS